MEKRMTSGEIAKKTGVSQKTVRFIKDRECFMARMAAALAPTGMCSINGASVNREHSFWQEIFGKLQLKTEFQHCFK